MVVVYRSLIKLSKICVVFMVNFLEEIFNRIILLLGVIVMQVVNKFIFFDEYMNVLWEFNIFYLVRKDGFQ